MQRQALQKKLLLPSYYLPSSSTLQRRQIISPDVQWSRMRFGVGVARIRLDLTFDLLAAGVYFPQLGRQQPSGSCEDSDISIIDDLWQGKKKKKEEESLFVLTK